MHLRARAVGSPHREVVLIALAIELHLGSVVHRSPVLVELGRLSLLGKVSRPLGIVLMTSYLIALKGKRGSITAGIAGQDGAGSQ
jgi:hypothetical protein